MAGVPARPAARGRERSYFSYGWVVFRAAPRTFRGRRHIDARNSFLFGETGLPGLIELSRLSGIPLQRLARSSPGTAISAMQIAKALSRGIIVPYKKREPETFETGTELVVTDKGGLPYLPRPGWHENVAELDFASMYPALMDRYNIFPETIRCRCCAPPDGQAQSRRGEAGTAGIPVPEIGSHTRSRRRGLVPEVLSPILEKRRLLQKRQPTTAAEEERDRFRKRQTALKWILVVCFGFLGYRNARCGRGVTLRPGSKIRFLLMEQHGRAVGFLDGSESPDLAKYGEMLREAAEELLGPLLSEPSGLRNDRAARSRPGILYNTWARSR